MHAVEEGEVRGGCMNENLSKMVVLGVLQDHLYNRAGDTGLDEGGNTGLDTPLRIAPSNNGEGNTAGDIAKPLLGVSLNT
jgi:hypothetical protein